MSKLDNSDIRRDACWLWNDLIMEAEFIHGNTQRELNLQKTLDKAADFIEVLFSFSEDEHYDSVVTRKYKEQE